MSTSESSNTAMRQAFEKSNLLVGPSEEIIAAAKQVGYMAEQDLIQLQTIAENLSLEDILGSEEQLNSARETYDNLNLALGELLNADNNSLEQSHVEALSVLQELQEELKEKKRALITMLTNNAGLNERITSHAASAVNEVKLLGYDKVDVPVDALENTSEKNSEELDAYAPTNEVADPVGDSFGGVELLESDILNSDPLDEFAVDNFSTLDQGSDQPQTPEEAVQLHLLQLYQSGGREAFMSGGDLKNLQTIRVEITKLLRLTGYVNATISEFLTREMNPISEEIKKLAAKEDPQLSSKERGIRLDHEYDRLRSAVSERLKNKKPRFIRKNKARVNAAESTTSTDPEAGPTGEMERKRFEALTEKFVSLGLYKSNIYDFKKAFETIDAIDALEADSEINPDKKARRIAQCQARLQDINDKLQSVLDGAGVLPDATPEAASAVPPEASASKKAADAAAEKKPEAETGAENTDESIEKLKRQAGALNRVYTDLVLALSILGFYRSAEMAEAQKLSETILDEVMDTSITVEVKKEKIRILQQVLLKAATVKARGLNGEIEDGWLVVREQGNKISLIKITGGEVLNSQVLISELIDLNREPAAQPATPEAATTPPPEESASSPEAATTPSPEEAAAAAASATSEKSRAEKNADWRESVGLPRDRRVDSADSVTREAGRRFYSEAKARLREARNGKEGVGSQEKTPGYKEMETKYHEALKNHYDKQSTLGRMGVSVRKVFGGQEKLPADLLLLQQSYRQSRAEYAEALKTALSWRQTADVANKEFSLETDKSKMAFANKFILKPRAEAVQIEVESTLDREKTSRLARIGGWMKQNPKKTRALGLLTASGVGAFTGGLAGAGMGGIRWLASTTFGVALGELAFDGMQGRVDKAEFNRQMAEEMTRKGFTLENLNSLETYLLATDAKSEVALSRQKAAAVGAAAAFGVGAGLGSAYALGMPDSVADLNRPNAQPLGSSAGTMLTEVDTIPGQGGGAPAPAPATAEAVVAQAEAVENIHTVVDGDTLTKIMRAEYADLLSDLDPLEQDKMLAKLFARVEADPILRDSIELNPRAGGDIDQIWPGDKLHLTELGEELEKIIAGDVKASTPNNLGSLPISGLDLEESIPIRTAVDGSEFGQVAEVATAEPSASAMTETSTATSPEYNHPASEVPKQVYTLDGKPTAEFKEFIGKYGSVEEYNKVLEKSVATFESKHYDFMNLLLQKFDSPYESVLKNLTLDQIDQLHKDAPSADALRQFALNNNLKYEALNAWLDKIDQLADIKYAGETSGATKVSDIFARSVAEDYVTKKYNASYKGRA